MHGLSPSRHLLLREQDNKEVLGLGGTPWHCSEQEHVGLGSKRDGPHSDLSSRLLYEHKGMPWLYDRTSQQDTQNATAYKDPQNWHFDEGGSYLLEAICGSLELQSQMTPNIGGIGV